MTPLHLLLRLFTDSTVASCNLCLVQIHVVFFALRNPWFAQVNRGLLLKAWIHTLCSTIRGLFKYILRCFLLYTLALFLPLPPSLPYLPDLALDILTTTTSLILISLPSSLVNHSLPPSLPHSSSPPLPHTYVYEGGRATSLKARGSNPA